MARGTTADAITAEVIKRLEATPNPRLREITMSLVCTARSDFVLQRA